MHNTLGGWDGLPCHHWDDELPVIAELLQATRPALVIELGTMHGGFAAFLSDTLAPWSGQVLTIDREVTSWLEEAVRERPRITFIRADIFSPLVASMLLCETRRVHLSRGASLLYCDGGEKERELTTYGGLADYVGVHDYGTEVRPEACRDWAVTRLYDPYWEERFAALAKPHISRFWTRRIR